ncbi:HPF/RaiA family ribosome-associated protein [Marinomonas sp. THO17]|uniref:HPF/RaiA family ribosome-associated protein n=1 Tax=Marinomonas sp. THO17 TaxID=3149048 RepID=UPI00336BAEDE
MNIKVQSRRLRLTKELKNYVKRRIGFALNARFNRIKRVVVTLSDVNGPKGGEDKRCQVFVQLDGKQDVIVDHKQTSLQAAIDIAADKVSRTVSKRIERLQHKASRIKSRLRRVKAQQGESKDTIRDDLEDYEYEDYAAYY